jgi:acetamidase/formamidase
MVSIHDVRPDAFNYVWDNSIEPVLEIESGESVELHVRDASDEQIHKGSAVEDVAKLDFSHVNPVSGPVFVKGARAGDVLEVELLEFKAKDWGWTAIIPGFGLLAEEFPEPWLRISEVDAASERVRFGEGITLPHRPFPGTLGVAPAEAGEHSIVPPSRFGGNMDVKHLRAGVKLFLPVGVDGALFSLGDTHAAQGDGEVCGTAIEAAMDVVLRLSVRSDLSILAPQLPTGPFGRDRRLRHFTHRPPPSSKICSGMNAPTTQLGASTTSWMRRSATTLARA